ncbi:MAG: superinfection immunity protein [Parvularculaceae bacterium]
MNYIEQKFAPITAMLEGASTGQIALVAIVIALVWFLPTIISLFRNPKNLGKIFLLNIPLGLTFIPWLILLGWSLNPKISFDQLKNKLRGRKRKARS